MGGPEIVDAKQNTLKEGIHIGLPLKITGIVFWGLVAIGLVLAAENIQVMNRDIASLQQTTTKHTRLLIHSLLEHQTEIPKPVLQRQLDRIVSKTDLAGIAVTIGLETTHSGDQNSLLTHYSDSFFIQGEGMPANTILLSIWLPPADKIVKPRKKRLMIEVGMLVFVFGVILQWILHKLLASPITRMVESARTCSRGEITQFDETRSDEFGYLAKFINHALNTLIHRQEEAVSALKRAQVSEQALFEEKERAEVTLHSIAEGVITTDGSGHIQYMNPVAESLSGYKQSEARGLLIDEVLPLKDEATNQTVKSSVFDCLREDRIIRTPNGCVLIKRDKEYLPIEENAAPIKDYSGHVIGAVLVFADVSKTRELTRKLSYQASHDTLTGLYNRREFEIRLRDTLKTIKKENTPATLCYMDLDQFKLVNDTCGHIAGDELLRQLAHKLKDVLRDSDVIARLGGDEFGVLLHGCNIKVASHIATKLRQAVREHHFTWNGKTFEVGVSVGVVPLSNDTRNVTDALSAADVACYAAKESGRNRVHVYESDDDRLQRKRTDMQWVSRIRHALRDNRFTLFHQPIVAVTTDAKNQPEHYEVLLRMLDEEGHLLSPGQFMSAAEQFGLMTEIDQWVLHNALVWLSSTSATQECRLAINLSGQSLSSPGFLESVTQSFAATKINPSQICFEITETAAIANLDNAIQFISTLKAQGCQFALDDFGNGMSSFAYLKNLPVDYLKIDGSYVRDLVRDPVDRAMVEAVNQIGHAMGMQTVAEFVEDEATLGALAVIGVDYAQGFGVAKPEPLDALSFSSTQALPLRKA